MKISKDTRDSLLFLGGLTGIAAQTVLAALGLAPSAEILVPLLTIYGGMMGLPAMFALDRRRQEQDNGDPDRDRDRSRG